MQFCFCDRSTQMRAQQCQKHNFISTTAVAVCIFLHHYPLQALNPPNGIPNFSPTKQLISVCSCTTTHLEDFSWGEGGGGTGLAWLRCCCFISLFIILHRITVVEKNKTFDLLEPGCEKHTAKSLYPPPHFTFEEFFLASFFSWPSTGTLHAVRTVTETCCSWTGCTCTPISSVFPLRRCPIKESFANRHCDLAQNTLIINLQTVNKQRKPASLNPKGANYKYAR